MMESKEVETQHKTNNWVIFGTSTPPLTLTIDHFRWNDDNEVAERAAALERSEKSMSNLMRAAWQSKKVIFHVLGLLTSQATSSIAENS